MSNQSSSAQDFKIMIRSILSHVRLSFVVIGIILVVEANTQPLTSIPYNMMLETADQLMDAGDFYNAEEYYDKAYRESRDPNIAAQLGYLNYLLRNYKTAATRYNRLLERDDENVYIEDRFYYAMTLKAQGQYPEAMNEFQRFIEFSDQQDLKEIAQKEIKGMQEATLYEENVDVVVSFAEHDINSAFVEYSPKVYPNGDLYFAAIPSRKVVKADPGNDDQYSRIFVSKKSADGYEKPEELDKTINRPRYHTGNPAFSTDGKRMYFTRSKLDGSDLNESELYVSYFEGEEWGPAYEVDGINGDFIITHPVVGELFGDEVLFYVSDMEGGEGGMDIYYSTIRGEDELSAPVNLGPVINTAYDEVTPYNLNGKLYFSSDGHPGLGGLDIFTSEWDGQKWSKAQNLGLNYNSSFDDMNISYDALGQYGFLVSNRPDEQKKNMKSKTCCDDIYEFRIRQLRIDLLVDVNDSNGPLNGATVTLIDRSMSKTDEAQTLPDTSKFNFFLDPDYTYKALITREGYYPDSIEFNTTGIIEDHTINKSIVLKPIPFVPEEEEPEFEIITINEAIRLNNIYYEFEKWDILPDAERDLRVIQDLMMEYPDMVIELSSHTDSRGTTPYNQKLSQRRAQSATLWLQERGVQADRLKAVGYGESQILNGCVNGKRCSEDDHQFNRRTEFKIIEGPQEIIIKKEVLKGVRKDG